MGINLQISEAYNAHGMNSSFMEWAWWDHHPGFSSFVCLLIWVNLIMQFLAASKSYKIFTLMNVKPCLHMLFCFLNASGFWEICSSAFSQEVRWEDRNHSQVWTVRSTTSREFRKSCLFAKKKSWPYPNITPCPNCIWVSNVSIQCDVITDAWCPHCIC